MDSTSAESGRGRQRGVVSKQHASHGHAVDVRLPRHARGPEEESVEAANG